jgi:hypothetical protein
MRTGALAFLVLALGAHAVPPQAPPGSGQPSAQTPSGAISGVVVDDTTGAPIADAIVFLAAARIASGVQPRQFTDARGRFIFTGLPPAPNYALSASKPGYLTGGYSDFGMPAGLSGLIALDDGEWVSSARIVLTRTGAISGAVTDEAGEPVVGVYVRLYARIPIQGRPQLASGSIATTDDRGAYRFGGLAPGRYLVAVPATRSSVPAGALGNRDNPTPAVDATSSTRLVVDRYPIPPLARDGVPLAYAFTFFPGTPQSSQAAVIELKPGEERANTDVRLDPVPTGRISGTVEGPAEALTRLTLRLLAEGLEGMGHGAETATALVAADGRFEFVSVPAGTYTLEAPLTMSELALVEGARGQLPRRMPVPPGTGGFSMNSSDVPGAPPGVRLMTLDFRSGVPSFAGRTAVTVRAGDATSVTLTLRPLGRMTGRIAIDPDSLKSPDGSQPPPVGLRLEPAHGDPTLGFLNAELDQKMKDRFTIDSIRSGPYVLRVAGSVWTIKSAIWRGRDYLDQPFDAAATPELDDVLVTVTRTAPIVSGMVRDERGRPGDASAVIIFPVDATQWSGYGFAPPRLKMARTASTGAYHLSVPPGDYYLIVVPARQATAWQDPAFLEKAAAGAARVSLEWGAQTSRDLVIK